MTRLWSKSNRPVHALSGIMGNHAGQDCKETKRQNIHLSLYFHSEIHFREKTNTVSRETTFLFLLAFLSRLSWALAYLSE